MQNLSIAYRRPSMPNSANSPIPPTWGGCSCNKAGTCVYCSITAFYQQVQSQPRGPFTSWAPGPSGSMKSWGSRPQYTYLPYALRYTTPWLNQSGYGILEEDEPPKEDEEGNLLDPPIFLEQDFRAAEERVVMWYLGRDGLKCVPADKPFEWVAYGYAYGVAEGETGEKTIFVDNAEKKCDNIWDAANAAGRSEHHMTDQQKANVEKLVFLSKNLDSFCKLYNFSVHSEYRVAAGSTLGPGVVGDLYGLAAITGMFNGEGLWAVKIPYDKEKSNRFQAYISGTPKGKAMPDSEVTALLQKIFGTPNPEYDDDPYELSVHGGIEKQVEVLQTFLSENQSTRYKVQWQMTGTCYVKDVASQEEVIDYLNRLGYRDVIQLTRDKGGTLDSKQYLSVELDRTKKALKGSVTDKAEKTKRPERVWLDSTEIHVSREGKYVRKVTGEAVETQTNPATGMSQWCVTQTLPDRYKLCYGTGVQQYKHEDSERGWGALETARLFPIDAQLVDYTSDWGGLEWRNFDGKVVDDLGNLIVPTEAPF
jgi:hypothetical protein